MAGAIPLDPDSQVTLSGARAEAQQALDQFHQQYQPSGPPLGKIAPPPSQSPGGLQPAPPPTQEAIEGNEGIIPGIPSAAPPPSPQAIDQNTEDNGEYGVSSAMHFLRDSFKGTGGELGNAVPRALSRLGGWITNAAAGGIFAGESLFGSQKHYEDAVFDWKKKYVDDAVEHWTPDRAAQTGAGVGSGGGAQAIGNAAEMIPGILTGGAGITAQILQSSTDSAMNDIDQGASLHKAIADGTVDGVATLLTAKLGVSPSASILKRVIKSASAGGLVQMGANVLKAGINKAYGDPNAPPPDLLQGVDENTILGGLFGLKRHTTGLEKGNPNPGGGNPKSASGSGPTPPGPEGGSGSGATAPAPSQSAIDSAEVTVAPGQPVPAGTKQPVNINMNVPDQPSVEPHKDIKAQFADMNDKNTPRQGVFVTPETQTHLTTLGDKTVDQAKAQGRTIDLPQGTLVLKTKGDVIKINNRLKAGEDPQTVIGSVTGAGLGKSTDNSAVVQGRTNDGAVATETAVQPTDVPMAVQKAIDQGKTPVVTTPQEAISRRLAERDNELPRSPRAQVGPGYMAAPDVTGDLLDDARDAVRNGTLQLSIPAIQSKYKLNFKQAAQIADQLRSAKPEARSPVAPTETTTSEHESNATPAEPAQRMGIFTSGAGQELPVHIEEGAPTGKLRVRPIDTKTGEPSDRAIDVPAERVKESQTSQTSPAATSEVAEPVAGSPVEERPPSKVNDSAEVTSQPTEAPRNEIPTGSEAQEKPGKPAEDTSARKPQTALQALPEALATHIEQETPPSGKKNAASLAERQDNASAFAAVLDQAAKESKGLRPDSTVKRASDAAKAAVNLTLKSKNATDKGQGTSHARVTALVEEMHRSARELLGTATSKDREAAVAPKAAALKARIAARKLAPEKPAAPEKGTAADVIAKDTKRAGLPVKEQTKTNKLIQEYLHSDFDEHPKTHEALLNHFHALAEEHGDAFPKSQIDTYMHFLMDQRNELNEGKTGRMSDTLEPEQHEFEQPEEGFTHTYRPVMEEGPGAAARTLAARTRLKDEWSTLASNMHGEGFFGAMNNFRDTGEAVGSHFVLNKMLENVKTPLLRTLLTAVRQRAPDAPIFNRSSTVDIGSGRQFGEGSAGTFQRAGRGMAIQYNFDHGRRTQEAMLRGVTHEIVHAATEHEIEGNPRAPHVLALHAALDTLRDRLANKYGQDVVDSHVDYFNGKGERPADYMRKLYGLSSVHEMAAEVLSNPDFIQEVAESEDYKSPREAPTSGKNTLLSRVFKAIGQFFGIKDAGLLQHIVDNTFETMDNQRQHRPEYQTMTAHQFVQGLPERSRDLLTRGTTPIEEAQIGRALMSIGEQAPPIHGVSKRLAVLGEGSEIEPTAREFAHVFKSRAIDGLRKGVMALKTVGQLYRDHMADFGHDDSTNPLRAVQETDIEKQGIIHKLREITAPVAQKWQRLSAEDDHAVSKLMIDTTMYKLDPRDTFNNQSATAKAGKGAQARYDQFKATYDKLSPAAREVYSDATDANRKLLRAQRKAGVDTAIGALDANLTDAQKGLLYGAKSPKVYDSLIGKGKLIDIGENNDKLKSALGDFSGLTELDGPYHHLGRQGDYVVQAEPEGTREFDSRAAAEEYQRTVSSLSPGSRAKVAERGGKFAVDFKAQYVSMHETRREAEQERDRLDKANLNPGKVTQKTLGNAYGALTHGMQELVTEAERKIQKNGSDEGTRALVDSLRSAFLQMTAARSAYAGSRLARKNFGGVKPGDMRRNFAEHALSAGWHTAQMQTAFDRAEAMAKVRSMARDSRDEASQNTTYRRGQLVDALNKHAVNEVNTFGQKAPFNAMLAKLGFMSYLASPSHAAIWLTQNITTGIPVAGPQWGYGKAVSSFGRAMAAVTSPSIRAQMKAAMGRTASSDEVHQVLLDAIAKHPTFGKWASGPNSHLRQLFDRGVISHSYADELGAMAEGPSNIGKFVHGYDNTVERVMGWARVLPAMADSINRLSTALAGLEMTGGDIRKTSDFVQKVHADYSAANKPLAFKALSKIPGGNSLTMFKTYVQEMSHLLYSNLVGTFHGDNKAEAAKTLAGLVIGNALFAGVASAVGIEPLRLALYAYHKIADEEGDVWDFRNAVHRFLNDHFGQTAGNLAAGGLPRLLNADVSQRMGLSDLFFHNPPDLLSADKDAWKNFFFDQLGPMPQELAGNVTSFYGKAQRGDIAGAVSSVVPIKQWQDAAKALQLLEAGRQDSNGGQLTQPSAPDAITQFLGFKPADVATAQERQGVKVEYATAAKQARTDIVKQLVSARTAGESAAAYGRLNRWNRNNPTMAIGAKDIARVQKQQEETTYDVPERNEKANEATNF